MVHSTELLACPACKTYMDKASNTREGQTIAPRDGDFCICANCAEILCFVSNENAKAAYRKANEADIEAAINDGIYDHLLAARNFILTKDHGLRNMSKEQGDLLRQKQNN